MVAFSLSFLCVWKKFFLASYFNNTHTHPTHMFGFSYYAGIPLATNLLFYSLTNLSTSISSSKNVARFISEHKDSDAVLFHHALVDTDLEHKMSILQSLVDDLLRKSSRDHPEFLHAKNEILHPTDPDAAAVTDHPNTEWPDVTDVQWVAPPATAAAVLNRLDPPVKLALVSLTDTLQQTASLLGDIRTKMEKYDQSYMKSFVALSLKTELPKLHQLVRILDLRAAMLLELLKVYLPASSHQTPRRHRNTTTTTTTGGLRCHGWEETISKRT